MKKSSIVAAASALFVLLVCSSVSTFAQDVKIDPDFVESFKELPELQDPGKPVQLAYKPKENDLWQYQLEVDSEMDTMGMVMPKQDRQLTKIRINSVNENGFEFTSQMAEVFSEMKTRGGNIRIDSANPDNEMADGPFVPLLNIWQVVCKSSLTCQSSLQGELANFDVPDEIKEAVGKEGGAYGIRPEDLASGFVIGFSTLPSEPVSVGDQWEMQTIIAPFGAEGATQTGTFLGTAEMEGINLAVIQVEFTMESEEKLGMMSDLELLTRTLIMFDMEAGNIWRNYSLTELEMVLHVGDNEILQSSTGTATMQRIDD